MIKPDSFSFCINHTITNRQEESEIGTESATFCHHWTA